MPTGKSNDPAAPTERLYLIDSMSHIFRAFFAPMGGRVEPLTNTKGQVTQAVFIFTSMLRKLLSEEKPHYIAAVFESGEPTFRHETFSGYKAHRAEMPDDLTSQIPYIIRVCEAYNVPILNAPGFEADDVIGTLAIQAAARGLQAVIVSNDKDMCQLVRDPWIICMRQNSQNVKRKEPVPPVEWCDEAWVENKFGVPPAQIVDLLGLMGDAVDNIPGAPGIGAKGAVQLIQTYGSIENAMAHWEEVKHKTYRESLRDNVELIRQSKELATIRTDVNIELDLEKLQCKPPDRAAAYKLFRELEFQSLTREFSDAATAEMEAEQQPRRYRVIRKRAELENLVRGLWDAEHIGFAVADTTPAGAGLQGGAHDDARASGVALSTAAGSSVYVDLENFEDGADNAIGPLRDVLSNGLLEKSVHDLKRAVALVEPLGIELEGITDDTLLAAYLLDPIRSKYELADLAREAVNVESAGEFPKNWTEAGWRTAEAADLTAQTAGVLRGRILEQGLEVIYTEMEIPLAPLLYRMERAGLKVDTKVLSELSKYLGKELDKLTKKIYKVAGREFKINSPKQVGEVLEELNISSGRKTSTGRVSTSKAVLEELAQTYELPRLIIEYRELDKLKTVYTDALPNQIAEDGRIHGHLNQTVTATGRLSCLPAGTLVNTERGLVGIETVQVGEIVRTPYGPRNVVAWQATGEKPVVSLKLSNGLTFRCSSEHRIRSRGAWVEAKDISIDDPVYMSFTEGLFGDQTELHLTPIAAYTTRKSPILPRRWTGSLAEFVGYCMADGHIVHSNYNHKPDKIVLAFDWRDDGLIEYFTEIIRLQFGKNPTRRVTRTCLTLDVSGVDIAGAMIQLGAGGKSGDIRVPPSLFSAPEEIVAAFLRGYFEGDGCVGNNAGIQVRSVSRAMLEDVQQLLTLFGIPSTVRTGSRDPRGYAPRHTLRILGDRSKLTFQNRIGFLSEKKQRNCRDIACSAKDKSTAELLSLPSGFDINVLKPAFYNSSRQSNGRVPMPVMVFASKYRAGGLRTMTLSRAEWIAKSLLTEVVESANADAAKETLRFVKEAVASQLYEIHVVGISHEPAIPMYDIAVDEVEQYMAQGIVVHNSSDPNLQNIPIRTELGQRIRRAFVPEKGFKLISADYSQLELRLLAHVTHDPEMLDAFQKGEDIHERTARLVFGAKTKEELKEARRFAKIVNFAIAYAIEPFGLSQRVGITRKEAKKVIDDYYATYKGVRKFMEEVPERAREHGYVRSLYGRIRPIPSINDRNGNIRNRAEREAINHPIQGCLPYQTKVLTSEGYYPIGELYERGTVGLQVWTGVQFANFEVLNRGLCELAELHLTNGQVLNCDTRHEVLVMMEDGYCWKRYCDLQLGERICLSLAQEIEFGSLNSLQSIQQQTANCLLSLNIGEFGNDFFYWLGYYIGDGWITHRLDTHRWCLSYSLGVSKAENRAEIIARAANCTSYFESVGLRTNFRWQSEQKGELTIYSKGLIEFLARAGVNTCATASTKRVPSFIFRSPLFARKAFLRGVLESDGCEGGDGATTPSIHLCQRELLADLQLLFRTIGVESKLRGPYNYRGHVSYRLDLIGGMLGKTLGYSNCYIVRTQGIHAPNFLISAFLKEVSCGQLSQHSHKVLYSRLKHGGSILIYTLAEMLKASGVKFSLPLYSWSALRERRTLGKSEETFTLAVDNPLHRFDSEGVISKNTASDIMKIAMLKVDDAIRREHPAAKILMQVHDELLLEAPEAEAASVARIVKREMETAVELFVPLIAEVGVADNWMDTKR